MEVINSHLVLAVQFCKFGFEVCPDEWDDIVRGLWGDETG